MIKPGKSLGYMGDADAESWVNAARDLQRFPADFVIPGHAKWGGMELVKRTEENAVKSSQKMKNL